jgi:uncharacterized protein
MAHVVTGPVRARACVAWTTVTNLASGDPIAVAAVEAIHEGNVTELTQLVRDHPELALARITDGAGCGTRTLLHVVTDWPGHFPNGAASIAVLAGGTPLTDATAFGQWNAARRLLERGAQATMWEAATMGLATPVEAYLSADPPPSAEEVTRAPSVVDWLRGLGARSAADIRSS